MDKNVKTDVWEENSFLMTASYEDFDGYIQKWKDSFYEIWRYQMTYSFAYDIEVLESRRNGLFVSLRVKPSFRQQAEEMLEYLGYRNVNVTEEKIGVVETYDVPDDWWDVILG